jgi:hypothetical protein
MQLTLYNLATDEQKRGSEGEGEGRGDRRDRDDGSRGPKDKEAPDSDRVVQMIVLGFVVLLFVLYWLSREEAIESTLKQFELDVMSGNVSKIDIINDNRVRVYLSRIPSAPSYYFNIGSLGAFETALDNLQNELNISAENRIVVKYRSEVNML